MFSRFTVSLIVYLLISIPTEAPGQSAQQDAQTLFMQANRAFADGDHQKALHLYLRARVLYPSYRIDLNAGGVLDALGRQAEAAVYLESALSMAQADQREEPGLKAAQERLDALRQALGSITLNCMEAESIIEVDGRILSETPLRTRIYVEPGPHFVVVRKRGFETDAQEVTLVAGEHRFLVVTLRPLPHVRADRVQTAIRQEDLARQAQEADRARRRHRLSTRLGLSALGLGLACGIVAGVMYGLGETQGDEAYAAYTAARVPADMERHWQDVQSAQHKIIAGHVLAGTALAATATGIVVLLSRPSVETREAGAISLRGIGLPTGGGLVLQGGF